jgi:cyclophilin family peptidyl-prolyl cis-trans isomerase
VNGWRALALATSLAFAPAACGGGGAQEETPVTRAPLPPDIGNPAPRVVLETNLGRIVLELNRDKAPKTVDNILWHVEHSFYDGLTFHRVKPGFMIQAGGFTSDLHQRVTQRPPVPNESNNGLPNVRGSVAMARTTDPHSATTQFFINLVDNAALDFKSETVDGWGYAVFGSVVEGMEVVDAIASIPTSTQGTMDDVPVRPAIIARASVEGR